ncbi:cache domain-containing sensor histidine kinase [Cohnella thailandensis]|uniref:histidine kinase n=1 Tax=Cohnella thailandensis TaxID=557557 RepID=A0A841SS31_9BACL|nr:sensor histidine kinase [Cohnella thailandensis]MBB6634744.1 sensor histidine kinase [Cohnella thailandensis]MBP1977847.1 two-component system sensor histidine kinase YesM [Cohnella thailandensis]
MFRTSIRTKLMALLLAATIIPILISMLVSNHYIKSAVTEKSIKENQTMLSLGANNILNYMNTINRVSLNAYNSNNSPTSMFAIIERGSAANVVSETFDANNRMTLYTHLLNMYQSLPGAHQIQLQILGPDRMTYLLARGLYRGGSNSTIEWPSARANNPKPFVEATHRSAHYAYDRNRSIKEESVFTLRRPIIRTPSDEIIGYLSIDIKSEELEGICSSLVTSSKETLYLMDRSGQLLCSANSKLDEGPLQLAWTDRLLSLPQESGHIEWQDDSFSGIVIYDTLQTNFMDWIVVKELPYSYLYEDAQTVRTINSLIIALFLVVVVLATLFISFQFTRPIKQLILHINKAQIGNLNAAAVPVQSKDEIGILARRFNSMMGTIGDLINKEYKLELANKTNQLKAMQAQINPHFLNNSLQSIGTLALQSKAPKVYSLLSSLARMMRYTMNTNDAIVPLESELAHAKAFLELQQQRFSDQIDIAFDIDPASRQVLVPKMLLQPLVENYFKHGYEPQGGAGALTISSRMTKDGWLLVQVEDNGLGVPPARLDELQQQFARLGAAPLDEAEEGIGLRNVAMRLKLYFGEKASLSIDSPGGGPGGFRVALRIPLQSGLEVEGPRVQDQEGQP